MPTKFQKIKDNDDQTFSIGVLSDTHGLLRQEVLTAFKGVDLILHAGDVGDPEVIEALGLIAPIVAVRGNMDYGSWADALPVAKSLAVADTRIYLIHDIEWVDRQMDLQTYHVVVTGHTHRPLVDNQNNVLFFNPGSAGHRRRQYPVSVGKLCLRHGRCTPELIELNV